MVPNMSSPTPVQSFLGGIALALPVHSLLLLNGSILGISGFVHRAVRGDPEAFFSVAAFLAAGFVIGLVEGPVTPVAQSLQRIALSGLLVGVGTKVRRVFPLRRAFSDGAGTAGVRVHVWVSARAAHAQKRARSSAAQAHDMRAGALLATVRDAFVSN